MQSFMPLTGIDATSTKRTGFLSFSMRLKKSCPQVAWCFSPVDSFLMIHIHLINQQKQDVSFSKLSNMR